MFGIQKYPTLNYFMQEAQLPSIRLGEALQVSRIHDIKLPGDTLIFDDLNINFLVDEKMDNYLAIQHWMFGLGFPESNDEFTQYINSSVNNQSFSIASKSVSDCFLIILDSNNLPVRKFTFMDAFPTSLSAVTVQSTNNDVNYIVGNLTLAYTKYTVG